MLRLKPFSHPPSRIPPSSIAAIRADDSQFGRRDRSESAEPAGQLARLHLRHAVFRHVGDRHRLVRRLRPPGHLSRTLASQGKARRPKGKTRRNAKIPLRRHVTSGRDCSRKWKGLQWGVAATAVGSGVGSVE